MKKCLQPNNLSQIEVRADLIGLKYLKLSHLTKQERCIHYLRQLMARSIEARSRSKEKCPCPQKLRLLGLVTIRRVNRATSTFLKLSDSMFADVKNGCIHNLKIFCGKIKPEEADFLKSRQIWFQWLRFDFEKCRFIEFLDETSFYVRSLSFTR